MTSYDIKYTCPIRVEKLTVNRNVLMTSQEGGSSINYFL